MLGSIVATSGFDVLKECNPEPKQVWNRIADEICDRIIARALEELELSPSEVAFVFTDAKKNFVSESSLWSILKTEALSHRRRSS